MWNIFQSIGIFDRIKTKGSLKNYQKKLQSIRENEADVLIDMGILSLEKEKFDESLQYLEDAHRIYFKLDEKEAEAFVMDLIGDVYLSMRKIDKALEKYQKSFQIYASVRSPLKEDLFEKIKEVEDIKEAIDISSEDKLNEEIEEESNYDATKETEEETTYDSLDDEKEEYLEDTRYKCNINYEKIAFKIEKIMKIIKKRYKIKEYLENEYEISYIRKSLVEAHKQADKEKEAVLFLMMGDFFIREGKPYSTMKSFKDAFNLFYEIGDDEGKALSLLLLGVIYYVLGNEDKIYSIFKGSVDIFKKLNDDKGKATAIDLINTLYNEDICLSEDSNLTVT